jgi:Spy/CpxP family protein refolding chaperone
MHASRNWLSFLLLLTLVMGGIGGVLAERLLFTPVAAAPPPAEGEPGDDQARGREHDRGHDKSRDRSRSRSHWRGRSRLDRYTKSLKLDEEQQTQLGAVFEASGTEYREMFESMKPKMTAVREASRERVRALLRPEQVADYEAMIKEYDDRRARWGSMWGRKDAKKPQDADGAANLDANDADENKPNPNIETNAGKAQE